LLLTLAPPLSDILVQKNPPVRPGDADLPVLICDTDPKLAKSLPRNFHTTDDPIRRTKAKSLQPLALPIFILLGCGEFTADGLKLLLARRRGLAASGWPQRVGLGLFLRLTLL
jgi:hypothetical protein